MTGVRNFAVNRADYDMLRLEQRLAIGAVLVCLIFAGLSMLYLGAWLTVAFIGLGSIYYAAALFVRSRADSILQRAMAASLLEEGPVILAAAA